METRPIDSLKNWEENPRNISKASFEELKKEVRELGQHSTFLIMPDGTVLGGNMRLLAMKEVGFTDVKCIVVDFMQEPEGWCAVIDGEPQRTKYYETKEQAMSVYSFSHNSRSGHYDADLTSTLMAKYNIATDAVKVDFYEPTTIKAQLERINHEEKKEEIKQAFNMTIKCADNEQRTELFKRLTEEGYICQLK